MGSADVESVLTVVQNQSPSEQPPVNNQPIIHQVYFLASNYIIIKYFHFSYVSNESMVIAPWQR